MNFIWAEFINFAVNKIESSTNDEIVEKYISVPMINGMVQII